MLKKLLNILFFVSCFTFNIASISTTLISIILLIFIIVVSLMTDKSYINFKYQIKGNNTFIFSFVVLVVWVLYSILTVGFSKDVNLGKQIIINLVYMTGILIAMRLVIKNVKDFFSIINTISLVVIINNIIGWNEVIFKKYYFIPDIYKFEYTHKGFPVSTFYNTNNYAMFLFIGFFFLLISFRNTTLFIMKLIILCSMVSTVLLIVQTDSRGCLASLLIGLFVIILVNVRNLNVNTNQLVLIYVILSALMILSFYLFSNYFDQIQGLFVKKKNHESNNIRFHLWKNGLYFLRETNYMGVGVGSLDYWLLNKGKYATYGFSKIHNWWIEIISTYGIFIFALYVISYLKQLIFYLKCSINKNFTYKSITLIFFGLMVGFIVGAMSPSSLFATLWIWPILSIFIFGTFIFNENC